MASRGDAETERMRKNVESQLSRLITQLKDLEEMREDLDDEEYEETRKETLAQMEEFEGSLKRMMEGNMTLVDELGSVQLAIQATIRNAFKTPEVIQMFAKREPDALRSRLATLESDLKLRRITEDAFSPQCVEILAALEKLGEELTPAERNLLARNERTMDAFTAATENIGESTQAGLLTSVSTSVRRSSGADTTEPPQPASAAAPTTTDA